MMTVNELIEKLQALPPEQREMEVVANLGHRFAEIEDPKLETDYDLSEDEETPNVICIFGNEEE